MGEPLATVVGAVASSAAAAGALVAQSAVAASGASAAGVAPTSVPLSTSPAPRRPRDAFTVGQATTKPAVRSKQQQQQPKAAASNATSLFAAALGKTIASPAPRAPSSAGHIDAVAASDASLAAHSGLEASVSLAPSGAGPDAPTAAAAMHAALSMRVTRLSAELESESARREAAEAEVLASASDARGAMVSRSWRGRPGFWRVTAARCAHSPIVSRRCALLLLLLSAPLTVCLRAQENIALQTQVAGLEDDLRMERWARTRACPDGARAVHAASRVASGTLRRGGTAMKPCGGRRSQVCCNARHVVHAEMCVFNFAEGVMSDTESAKASLQGTLDGVQVCALTVSRRWLSRGVVLSECPSARSDSSGRRRTRWKRARRRWRRCVHAGARRQWVSCSCWCRTGFARAGCRHGPEAGAARPGVLACVWVPRSPG